MKKILTVLIACALLSGCNSGKTSSPETLAEISDLVFNKGYGEEEVLEIVNGVYYEDLEERWGEHGGLSGFWGDTWEIENDGNKKQIIVYYDSNGNVENVVIKETEKGTGENNREE